ncbi:MAG: STAS domain-containing protein [Nitrospirae bacterium]|nr:MAG: STAS domain-containing protein [Nitrospirota bacterium]
MGEYRMSESEIPGTLIISGSLGIENSARIKEALMEVLERSEHIVLKLEKDSSVDLSFLQILCAAHRAATLRQKTFEVLGANADNFELTVTDTGYARTCGCAMDKDHTCLWVRGGKK